MAECMYVTPRPLPIRVRGAEARGWVGGLGRWGGSLGWSELGLGRPGGSLGWVARVGRPLGGSLGWVTRVGERVAFDTSKIVLA